MTVIYFQTDEINGLSREGGKLDTIGERILKGISSMSVGLEIEEM